MLATVALAACVLQAGCGSSEPTMAQSPDSLAGQKILLAGEWQAGVEEVDEESDATNPFAREMAREFAATSHLEFPTENEFRLTMMGWPLEGRVERSGLELTLVPVTFIGRPVAEAKGNSPDMHGLEQPMKGTLSTSGSELRLYGRGAKEGVIVFTRRPPAPPRKRTVSAREASLVGAWKGLQTLPDEDKMYPDERKMRKALADNIRLRLHEDNTFTLHMMAEITGTWKREGERFSMVAKEIVGFDDGGMTEEPILFRISADGRTLLPESLEDLTFNKLD